jgi:hypothetical protein
MMNRAIGAQAVSDRSEHIVAAAVGLSHMTIDGEHTLRHFAAGRGVCRWGVECSPVR